MQTLTYIMPFIVLFIYVFTVISIFMKQHIINLECHLSKAYVAFPDVLLQHVLYGNSIQCLCQVQLCHTLYSLATIIISMQIKYFGEAYGRLDQPIKNSISCIKPDHASVVQLTKTKTKKHFSKAYFN